MTDTNERPAPHRCPHPIDSRRGVLTDEEGFYAECTECGLQGRPQATFQAALNSFYAAIRRERSDGGSR